MIDRLFVLSLLKIISGRSCDAIRTELAWRRWVRTVGQLAVSARPWLIPGACGSHCNNASITSAPGVNAVRRRSAYDPSTRVEAFRSDAQHRGSATAIAVRSVGR